MPRGLEHGIAGQTTLTPNSQLKLTKPLNTFPFHDHH